MSDVTSTSKSLTKTSGLTNTQVKNMVYIPLRTKVNLPKTPKDIFIMPRGRSYTPSVTSNIPNIVDIPTSPIVPVTTKVNFPVNTNVRIPVNIST